MTQCKKAYDFFFKNISHPQISPETSVLKARSRDNWVEDPFRVSCEGKTIFIVILRYYLLFSHSHSFKTIQWGFPEATCVLYHNRLNTEVGMRIQLIIY